jgi:hypothetical protein
MDDRFRPRVRMLYRRLTVFRECPDGQRHPEQIDLDAQMTEELLAAALTREAAEMCRPCREALAAEQRARQTPEEQAAEAKRRAALWD